MFLQDVELRVCCSVTVAAHHLCRNRGHDVGCLKDLPATVFYCDYGGAVGVPCPIVIVWGYGNSHSLPAQAFCIERHIPRKRGAADPDICRCIEAVLRRIGPEICMKGRIRFFWEGIAYCYAAGNEICAVPASLKYLSMQGVVWRKHHEIGVVILVAVHAKIVPGKYHVVHIFCRYRLLSISLRQRPVHCC